jgi:hypothetical protein
MRKVSEAILEVIKFAASAIVALIAACLAVYMVWKSYNLLEKGVIAIREADAADAIKVDFHRLITVQTRYPALAFFVLAITCLGFAFWQVRSMPEMRGINPMKLTASLTPTSTGVDTAFFEDPDPLGSSRIDSTGKISTEILPKIIKVRIRIPTPGYAPGQITKDLSPDQAKDGLLDFGSLSLGPTRIQKPDENPALIDTPPHPLAPLSAGMNPTQSPSGISK